MNMLFWGLLFLTLDVNIGLGSWTVNILPEFVGYILLHKGLTAMEQESKCFSRVKPWTVVLAIYTAGIFAARLLDMSVSGRLVTWALSAAAMAAGFYVTYQLVLGIQEMEQRHEKDLKSGKLKTMWTYWVVFACISMALSWLPLVGSAAVIVSTILAICFLVIFYQSKTAWEKDKMS